MLYGVFTNDEDGGTKLHGVFSSIEKIDAVLQSGELFGSPIQWDVEYLDGGLPAYCIEGLDIILHVPSRKWRATSETPWRILGPSRHKTAYIMEVELDKVYN